MPIYFVQVLLIGSLGLLLSYGLFCTAPWFWAYAGFLNKGKWANRGGIYEGYRLFFILVGFTICHTAVGQQSRLAWDHSWNLIHTQQNLLGSLSPISKVAAVILYVGVPIHCLILGPVLLKREASREFGTPISLRDAWLPFSAYLLYALAVYVLAGVPIIAFVERIMHEGWRNVLQESQTITAGVVGGNLNSYFKAFQVFRDTCMKSINGILVICGVAFTYLVFEVSTRVFATLSRAGQEVLRWSVFLLVMFGAILAVRIALTYNDCFETAVNHISSAEEQMAESREQMKRFRSENKPAGFLLELSMSGGMIAVVLFTVIPLFLRKYLDKLDNVISVVAALLPWPIPQLLAPIGEMARLEPNLPERSRQLSLRQPPPVAEQWRGRPLRDYVSRR